MVNTENPEASANKIIQQELLSFQDTDAGNAEAFELLYEPQFRFNHTSGKWMVWNWRYWQEDKDGAANRAALLTVRLRFSAAMTITNHEEMERRTKWAKACEAVFRLEALLKSARTIRSLATTTEQYDQHPFLFTVANGTLDLRTGTLQPSQPQHLITRASDVQFDASAKAPRWHQFLNQIFGGDADLIEYLQRIIGYSLTADTREQCFFVFYGEGSNGKSTLVVTVCNLFGTHSETAEFSTLLAHHNVGSPRNDLARLHAARFVKASEGEQEAKLAESFIKEVTGEDVVAARFLFKEFFTFTPQFKLCLLTNHKPKIQGTDDAIWRRVRLIPFKQQFEGANKDPELRRKLQDELPGILNWALRGCLEWQKHGLGKAQQVEEATREYRRESDQVGRFLERQCVRGRACTAAAQRIYRVYRDWCVDQDEKPDANNLFARKLEQHGITKKRTSSGVVYQGLGLVPGETVNLVTAYLRG